ncbi:RNA methyltransferase [Filibacter tadaridae]|uniref:23S rRNA (Uridine(2479)-2'-O)-methyltransferase n=1 Tax=Filibacter tadaridae TaxID=2483811 RepID=A0A3P5XQM1_9BACL|nr:RNA methyltransferase [Filibacter tadaridae]VDC32712.1 23S rRNA (uridine(2479)-2'-O)-methyltransferase [Filibacter tadaridae]
MKRIESPQNALVKHWKKLVTTRKERDKSEEFVVEGFHLVEEALKQKDAVLALIVSDGVEIPKEWSIEGIHIVEVNQIVAREIAETEQSQGVFAHCRQPEHAEETFASYKKVLLVDAVQDPGNVGTMIRTADAAGMDAVILGKGSADPYNPKTVRSAQGSHFNIPVVKGDLFEWVNRVKEANGLVIGTGLQNAVNHSTIEPQAQFALIVGNEGSGVDPELLKLTDKTVKIPMYGKAESLNVAVATGILLYAYSVK